MSSPAPRLGDRLLIALLSDRDREAIAGDLAEEYALRLRDTSRGSAARWYWGQVCRSLALQLAHARWIATAAVALGVYVASSVLEFLATFVVARLVAPGESQGQLLSAAIGLSTMVLGGYVAARLRRGAERALAVIIVLAVVLLMAAAPGSASLWYGLSFLILGPAAALIGGTLAVRMRRRVFTT